MNQLLLKNNFEKLNELREYIPEERYQHLHEQAFLDTFNVILKFLDDSSKLYQKKGDYEWDIRPFIARVCNSIMGAGKTTALIAAGKIALERNDMPLLCVFNNLDTMKKFCDAFDSEEQQEIIRIDKEQYKIVQQNEIYSKKIVAIAQQRLYQIQLGYGNFYPFKFYTGNLQRTIIIDEMLDFVDGEIFDLGPNDNSLDWFDKMAKLIDMPRDHIRRARMLIISLLLDELTEYSDNNEHSLPTQKLLNHGKDIAKINHLHEVLRKLKNVDVDYKTKNRYKWFLELLEKDKVGVVNRDEKRTFLLCARWVDYRELGNILILDGTSDITKTIYDYGGYEFVPVHNYHDYKKRLHIDFRFFNTSKASRKKPETHEGIKADIKNLRSKYKVDREEIIVLPAKADIEKYRNNGVITEKQYKDYFEGRIGENESMALNILNISGKDDLASYNYMALLTLPIRHPIYYKKYGLAMYGTEVNIELNNRSKGSKGNKDGWFVDPRVQNLYEELFMSDFSQIIHRSKIRRIQDRNKVYIIIYSNRKEWIDKIMKIYDLPAINLRTEKLMFNAKEYGEKCNRILSSVERVLRKKEPGAYYPGQIKVPGMGEYGFKEWLKRDWKIPQRQIIIQRVGRWHNMDISEVENKKGKKEKKIAYEMGLKEQYE